MPESAIEFLEAQRICVLAIEMPDGAPHAATVHFATARDPLTLIFETDMRYRKTEALRARAKSRASLAVGFEEGKAATLQMDGDVQLIPNDCGFVETYLKKFPEKTEKSKGEHVIFFTFTPKWWKFTDWRSADGKKVFASDK